jgi:hypothetical protein
MRFLLIRKADKSTEAGVMPSQQLLTDMGKYMQEMSKAGILLAGEGLQPSSKGSRVKFSSGKLHLHRRPVRRDQGTHCRLLHDPGEIQTGGH